MVREPWDQRRARGNGEDTSEFKWTANLKRRKPKAPVKPKVPAKAPAKGKAKAKAKAPAAMSKAKASMAKPKGGRRDRWVFVGSTA